MTFNFGETFNINGANGDKSGLTFFNDTFWINKPSTPTPGWKDVTVTGEDSLNLPNAKANGLNYLKAYGKCYQGNLPYGYTQLESISGITNKSWIDTGVAGNNDNLRFIFTGYKDKGVAYTSFFANYIDESSNVTRLIALTASSGIIAEVNRKSASSVTTNSTNYLVAHTYELYKENGVSILKVDGTQVDTMANSAGTANSTNIAINASRINPSTPSSDVMTTFQGIFQIYDGTTLIRNYVMAKRDSDNAVGMYDTVNNTFKISEGTENFTAGADLKPLPTYPLAITCNNGTIKVRSKSGLPDGYVKLKYLESDGACYIDLNRVPNNNDIIENKFQKLGTSTTTNSWYGSMPSSSSTTPRIGLGAYTNGLFWGVNTTTVFKYPVDTNIHTIKFHAKTSTRADVTLDGVTTEQSYTGPTGSNYSTPAVQLTSYLFARHGSNGVQTYDGEGTRIFCHKESLNDGTLQLHVVPILYTPTNTLGMYDLVNGNFLTNLGTGTFTSGGIDEDDIEIYIDGTTETIKDSLNNTATAENLLSAGTYKDVQSILDGTVTRNIGVKVLTGEEDWAKNATRPNAYSIPLNSLPNIDASQHLLLCTHFTNTQNASDLNYPNYTYAGTAFNVSMPTTISTVDQLKDYFKQQYANHTPVIVIFPLATATTETVTAQILTTKRGDNTIEITQASLGDLTLEAEYQAGVTVTIEEVEEANLDNNVTVVIGE